MTRINASPLGRITRSVARSDLDISTSQHLVEGMVVPFDRPERVSDDGRTWYDEEVAPAAFD